MMISHSRNTFVVPNRNSRRAKDHSSDPDFGVTKKETINFEFAESEEGEAELPLATTTTTTTAKRSKDDVNDNFLGRYFREMSDLSVLKPEQEFESARKIETLEIDLWRHVLSIPALAASLCQTAQDHLEDDVAELKALSEAAEKLSKKVRLKANEKKQYEMLCKHSVEMLHPVDMDRCALFAVIDEVHRLAQGEHTIEVKGKTFNIKTQSFKNYFSAVNRKFSAAQRARNTFVKSNLRLVVSIARRFNHGRMPLSDLIQEGNIGLIKAVERYDYRRGFRFSTYASWWIRHAISRALADKGRAVRLPVHMIDAYHKVTKTRRELSNRFGRNPTSEEIAKESGLAIDKVRKLEGFLMDHAVSLDREVSDKDGRRFVDFIEDPDAVLPSDRIEHHSLNNQVLDLMGTLKPIESDILRKRFGLSDGKELTLKEIGEDYNLSRERIRQLQEQALGKIRRALRRQDAI